MCQTCPAAFEKNKQTDKQKTMQIKDLFHFLLDQTRSSEGWYYLDLRYIKCTRSPNIFLLKALIEILFMFLPLYTLNKCTAQIFESIAASSSEICQAVSVLFNRNTDMLDKISASL